MRIKASTKFKSNEEFQEIAKYLQHLLFLDDWFINFQLVADTIHYERDEDNTTRDAVGLTTYDYGNREATIYVQNGDNSSEKSDEDDDNVLKNIALLNLIHELLHLKEEYIVLSDCYPNLVDNLSDTDKVHKHMHLEQMAKSIFMAITGADKDFFYK